MTNLCVLFNCNKKNNLCCNPIHWHYNLLYGGGTKPMWTTLIHNGPMFPLNYKPHKIPVIINNNEVILPSLAEEYATMYSKYINSNYDTNTFKKNFWKDFKSTLPSTLNITALNQIDFSLIVDYLIKEKEKKTKISKEEKALIKKEQEQIEEPYKTCVIDGVTQFVGNYKIEPPGIFLGRGNHPKSGHIKKRVMPEDVIINLSKDAKIPTPNLSGHNWGEVIHDQSVIWLASWKEEITNKNKYIFTSMDSIFKSLSDESKFDLARKLKKKVNIIRTNYEKQLTDENIKNKQLATALYFIDKLALRVGGKKTIKEEADTVGVTSLRVEHITLLENNFIKLDFLGKDSIRYCKKVQVHEQVYNNLIEFTTNKSKKEELFDLINPAMCNKYLDDIMPGLTAKVWRTYNASCLFQKELDKIKEDKIKEIDANERLNYLLSMFIQANTSVALLCNHKKNVNVSHGDILKKLEKKIKDLKNKKKIYKAKKKNDIVKKIDIKLKLLKLNKDTKMKNVSLGTSKDNYIDPRIIFAFIKKYNIPEKEIFKKERALKRFEWASNVDENFKF
jgi:DNA topoisomerase-1